MTNKHLTIYLYTGLISGVIGWGGNLLLPEGSLAFNIFPGIILGLALFLCGMQVGAIPKPKRAQAGILLIVFTIVGWRLSVELAPYVNVYFRYIAPGAIGAFVVAIGLLSTWHVPRNRFAFVLWLTLSGAIGGLIFQLILATSLVIAEDLQPLVLLVEWQTILMLCIGLAMARSKLVENTN